MRLWTKALCSGSVQRIYDIPSILNVYIAYKIDSPKYLYINKFNMKKNTMWEMVSAIHMIQQTNKHKGENDAFYWETFNTKKNPSK